MLHIILGILKFIGIILAVILFLVAAVLLSLLFVPVRYLGNARKTPEYTDIELKVSWFLHFITFNFTFNLKQKKPLWTFRICGVTLENILKAVKRMADLPEKLKNRKNTEKNEISDDTVESDEDESEEETTEDIIEESSEETESDTEEVSEEETLEDSAEDDETDTGQELYTEAFETILSKPVAEANEKADKHTADTVSEESEKGLKTVFSKIADIFRKILSFVKSIPEKIGKIQTSALKKKEDIQTRIQNIIDRLQYYLGLSEKYEMKLLFGDVCTELFCMLGHYGPGRIKGYVHFGTGDPALTGELTGLLYMLLPQKASEFQIQPEFTEKVFETELIMKGKIRACHAVWLAWKLFRNKKLMRLIKEVRKSRRS